MKVLFIIFAQFFAMTSALADIAEDDIKSLTGYTVTGGKKIVHWHDAKGNKGDSFTGCDVGRVIEFDDHSTLTCTSSVYKFGFKPTAIILMQNKYIKMIVGDKVFDMTSSDTTTE